MKKFWFEKWFNSQDYLIIYQHRNFEDAKLEIDFILSNLNLNKNAKILDLACGSGRHSIYLAKKGFEVVSVDFSNVLLNTAIKNSNLLNLKIKFLKTDFRFLPLDEKFDLIINMFTSFGYFYKDEDNFLLFKKSYDLLNKGGYFVFDFFNKNHLLKNLVPLSERFFDNKKIIEKRYIRKGRIEKIIEIIESGNKRKYIESVKLYSPTEIQEQLMKNDFEIINLFGDFKGNNFNENYSKRFIAFCKK